MYVNISSVFMYVYPVCDSICILVKMCVDLPYSERGVDVHSQNMAGDVAISFGIAHIAHYEDAVEPGHTQGTTIDHLHGSYKHIPYLYTHINTYIYTLIHT